MDEQDYQRMEGWTMCVRETLVRNASYLSEMPDSQASFTNDKGGTLYFPGQAFFEQIVWNVGVALSVGILAAHLYEKLFGSNKNVLSQEEVERIAGELLEAMRKGPVASNETKDESVAYCVSLLERHGWPEEEAKSDVAELVDKTVEYWESRI